MELEAFTRPSDAADPKPMPLSAFLESRCGIDAAPAAALGHVEAQVSKGAFRVSLAAPSDLSSEAGAAQMDERGIFVELRFPARRFSPLPQSPPFIHIVEYSPATPDRPGLAPSSHGAFAWWTDAIGVSSNWANAKQDTPMKVLALDVPVEKAEEFRWLLACVCGEAFGTINERAWPAVAHVIVNRVGRREFGNLKNAKEVVQRVNPDSHRVEFSCYRDPNGNMSPNFQVGLRYSDPRKSGRDSLDAPTIELIDRIKKAILPVFLELAGKGGGATFFYSPEAGRNPPDFAIKYVDVTSELLGPANRPNFRFFALPEDRPTAVAQRQ